VVTYGGHRFFSAERGRLIGRGGAGGVPDRYRLGSHVFKKNWRNRVKVGQHLTGVQAGPRISVLSEIACYRQSGLSRLGRRLRFRNRRTIRASRTSQVWYHSQVWYVPNSKETRIRTCAMANRSVWPDWLVRLALLDIIKPKGFNRVITLIDEAALRSCSRLQGMEAYKAPRNEQFQHP
jgi:hypothetical protein